ncbi:hypothetical protein GCM10012319_18150 [Comamonas sp. KCTC 72670]|nr:hypothetical protein GCM10012319_18150 [Comamonas sp. KCTC 72670]
MTALLPIGLALSLSTAAGSPLEPARGAVAPTTPAASRTGGEQAREERDVAALLSGRCRQWAAAPDNPWALAHGMVLDGRDFRTRDGRPAAEAIIAGFLRQAPWLAGSTRPPPHGEGSAQVRLTPGTGAAVEKPPRADDAPPPLVTTGAAPGRLYFEPRTADGTPVEPHPALQVKTLLRAGYRLSHRFDAAWGPVTVRALVEQVQRDHRPALTTSPEGAWALDALSLAHQPGDTFRDGTGARVFVDAVMREALATLEAAQADLAEGMRAGRPEVPKRKQGIYAHPCGGLHYFQAVAGWARHASVRKAWRARLDTQVEVLLYRLDSEGRQYEAALASLPEAYRLPLLVQMLKFQGHLLETLGRYRDDTGWRPTPVQRKTVERARTALEDTVRRLDAAGAFDELSAIAAQQPQLALDLVGDTCHAAHGEALWRVPPLSAPGAPAPRR